MTTEYSIERRGDRYVLKKQTGGKVQYLYYGTGILVRHIHCYVRVILDQIMLVGEKGALLGTEHWREEGTVYQGGAGTNRHWGSPAPSAHRDSLANSVFKALS